MPTPTSPARLTPAEIAARFDADEAARKARIARSDERHAARMQASTAAIAADRAQREAYLDAHRPGWRAAQGR